MVEVLPLDLLQAVMKYYNDPAFLEKLGSKIGDVVPEGGINAGPPSASGPPPGAAPPEINDILDAAK